MRDRLTCGDSDDENGRGWSSQWGAGAGGRGGVIWNGDEVNDVVMDVAGAVAAAVVVTVFIDDGHASSRGGEGRATQLGVVVVLVLVVAVVDLGAVVVLLVEIELVMVVEWG